MLVAVIKEDAAPFLPERSWWGCRYKNCGTNSKSSVRKRPPMCPILVPRAPEPPQGIRAPGDMSSARCWMHLGTANILLTDFHQYNNWLCASREQCGVNLVPGEIADRMISPTSKRDRKQDPVAVQLQPRHADLCHGHGPGQQGLQEGARLWEQIQDLPEKQRQSKLRFRMIQVNPDLQELLHTYLHREREIDR